MMSSLFSPPAKGKDPEFAALLRPDYTALRDFIDRMWIDFERLADPDFRGDIATHFNQRYWEMYLACSLLDKGFTLQSAPAGPDIRFEHADKACWIEAIAPNAGDGADAVPGIEFDGVARFVPDEQVILRYCSAFAEKFGKYKNWIAKNQIGSADPYVIAISGGSVPYSQMDSDDLPHVVCTVLPFGNHYVVIDTKTMEIVDEGVQHRPGITKASGTSVSTTYFEDPEFAGVSAVLYARPTIRALPKLELGHLIYLVHNPLAANPLPRSLLPVATEFWVENGELKRIDRAG